MQVRVLDAREDAAEWRTLLGKLPATMQDVYFRAEWLELHSTGPELKPTLFVFSEGDNVLAYPFLVRTLKRIGGKAIDPPSHDIESAYGYGGPIVNLKDSSFIMEAWAAFSEWCRLERVVAEFVRLHPLLGNHELLPLEVACVEDRETVSINLREMALGKEPFGKEAQYMVRRATRGGVEIVTLSPKEAMAEFRQLYSATMERLAAERYYYFDDGYFIRLETLIEKHGWLLAAKYEGRYVAAALFLMGPCWMHYHLSAREPHQPVPGVTNLLLHRAAELGAANGMARMHLGGGAGRVPGDALLRFKRTMGTDGHIFRIGKRIHDPTRYAELKNIWEKEYPQARRRDKLLCYYDT